MAFHLTMKIEFFLSQQSAACVRGKVGAEQTIEEQKIKFDFYGDMEGHICGLLNYPTLLNRVQDKNSKYSTRF